MGSGPALMEVVKRKSDSRRRRARRCMTSQGCMWGWLVELVMG